MSSNRINSNYAKALLMLAEDRGQGDRVADDMRRVGEVCAASRELGVVFANPTVPHERKAGIVQELFGGEVSEETLAFLHFVVRKNRSVHLKGISDAYLMQWRERRGIVLSELTTHQPITDEAREEVKKLVAGYTGKQVELQALTDERMLGGFKLEFGHNMYDARLRTKIRKLRMEFAKNEYESKL